MAAINYQHDWATDSIYHKFPDYAGTNPQVLKILSFLKEYDETCLDARAQMFKKIYELFEKEISKK